MTTARPRTMRRWSAVVLMGVALVAAACVPETPTPTTTTPPTADQVALSAAGAWLDRQFTADGWFPGAYAPTIPDAVNAAQAIADLDALGVGDANQAARMARLEADTPGAIYDGTAYVPGALARVIIAVVVTGGDPRSFAGTDLVADLESTIQPDGRFGTQFAGYDGVTRQGLALAALSLVDDASPTVVDAATGWLRSQQCADGSWFAFRADTSVACADDTNGFVDSNATGMAILGLTAVGATPVVDPVPWLESVRGSDGGWGSFPAPAPTTASDADSTGLVIAALEALGHAPDPSAYAALRGFQLGATAPAADRGAFEYQPGFGASSYATLDAVTALLPGTWPAVLVPHA